MNQPLLTVIVPCYNVAKYIDKCVSTIVSQSYSNLEILLIDDGSFDRTGKICDVWQERDSRIRVIHKQNEGLAYARKTGIENTTAEYVTFVDADDWIDVDMYTNMMSALLSTKSDIAQCGVCDAFEDGRIQHRISDHKDGSFEIVDRIKGVLLILEDKDWKSYMWNKIFKKHLFNHIEFPKGRGLNEDSTIAHILFHHASQTVYLRDEYYFYLQRIGSITNSNHIFYSKLKNWYDTYCTYYERYFFVIQHPEYHSCLRISKNRVFARGIKTLQYSKVYPQFFPENYFYLLFNQLSAIPFTRKDIIREFYTLFRRLGVYVFIISPACFKMIINLYAKVKTIFIEPCIT